MENACYVSDHVLKTLHSFSYKFRSTLWLWPFLSSNIETLRSNSAGRDTVNKRTAHFKSRTPLSLEPELASLSLLLYCGNFDGPLWPTLRNRLLCQEFKTVDDLDTHRPFPNTRFLVLVSLHRSLHRFCSQQSQQQLCNSEVIMQKNK